MSESWIRLALDSPYSVAGEKLTGELFSCIYEKDTKLTIKIMGEEQVSIEPFSSSKALHQSTSIFTYHRDIQDPDKRCKSIFPFTFAIPDHAPASFHFIDTDSNNNLVSAEVFYILEAELHCLNEVICKDTIEFTVFSKYSKDIYTKSSNESITRLKSCCCIPRGTSAISIELMPDSKKFDVTIESGNISKLHSVITQVVFDIHLNLPDQNQYIRRVVDRRVSTPSILSFTVGGNKLSYEYEAFVNESKIGPNIASNKGKYFSSKFTLQVLAIYDIGLRSKESACTLPFFVNPVPVVNENLSVPQDWAAAEHYMTPKVSSGSSYNTVSDD